MPSDEVIKELLEKEKEISKNVGISKSTLRSIGLLLLAQLLTIGGSAIKMYIDVRIVQNKMESIEDDVTEIHQMLIYGEARQFNKRYHFSNEEER